LKPVVTNSQSMTRSYAPLRIEGCILLASNRVMSETKADV